MEITSKSKPHELFEAWMKEAKTVSGLREPTAMVLSTLASNGELHSRVVLCKSWSEEGFVFYTNYQSLKGKDLENSSQAAAIFYWDPMFRQVKISGEVVKTSRQQSEAYWNSREKGSQLSQYISHQSQEVKSREELEKLWREAEAEFQNKPIPCPPHWGGYILRPRLIEFWIGRENRLHDCYQFEKQGATWTFRRLFP
jgi:pyridoxamine 5'-phosphate oxidase